MITDIFVKRYEERRFDQDWAENIISPTVVQASCIFFQDVQPTLKFTDEFFAALIYRSQESWGCRALAALFDGQGEYGGAVRHAMGRRPMKEGKLIEDDDNATTFLAENLKRCWRISRSGGGWAQSHRLSPLANGSGKGQG